MSATERAAIRNARIPGANINVRRLCERCITTSYASEGHLVRDEFANMNSEFGIRNATNPPS